MKRTPHTGLRFFGLLVLLILASGCFKPVLAEPQPPVMHLAFDGNLHDDTGNGHDASAPTPEFVPGRNGQALKVGAKPALVPDAPDLRLAPGLRIECWVKLAPPASPDQYFGIVVKDNEYMLRVDSTQEGGRFTFFVFLGGWEPRVRSEVKPEPGVWYHLIAAWDGRTLSLDVNGQRTAAPRSGAVQTTTNPLLIGAPGYVVEGVRIDNPRAPAGVLHLAFDGNLRDDTGHGHDANVRAPEFVAGHKGQALKVGADPAVVPDSPDLRLAAGLRIECWAQFPEAPDARADIFPTLVKKNEEYWLRVDPGGHFSFFVRLEDWASPASVMSVKVEPGVWYHLIAAWDGGTLSLDVNGAHTEVPCLGMAHPGSDPVAMGQCAAGCLIDEVRIDNPRLPALILTAPGLVQEHSILRAGRPERVATTIENFGSDATNVAVALDMGPGAACLGGSTQELGALPSGAAKTVEWTVQAAAAVSPWARLRVTAAGCQPVVEPVSLAFFPPRDGPTLPMPKSLPGGVTYYVDSAAGRNTNSGTSPEAPWQDFTNINGKTLGPGEKLLIKRGSVINQELMISAHGTPGNWAEIGAYGTGPRPTIRRNWDIDDRCVLVRDPDYLLIRSLVVCYAGKGLIVSYENKGHAGLVIEDCIAHHIEGLLRPNSHGIPEWQGRSGAVDACGQGPYQVSAGIGVSGKWVQPRDILIRNCEVFQTSWPLYMDGGALVIDRVFCHDNYIRNTSAQSAFESVTRSYLQDSIFDAASWSGTNGTAAIMLINPEGLVIRNCIFCNEPDVGSAGDMTGIDFENLGSGCLIDHCTFENNAGAAVRVYGGNSPQPRNVEIAETRFIRNDWAHLRGAGDACVWGGAGPEICCSTGTIHDSGYVTSPGVPFFVNQAPQTTQWALHNNTAYATVEDLKKAMPFNEPPVVKAGPDIRTDSKSVHLAGSVTDDGKPGITPLTVRWEVLEGPGDVMFRNDHAPDTSAEFLAPGDYVLRLVGDDGELWRSAMVTVHILPPGASVAKAWEFNTPLDKEGWTEVNPGWNGPVWPSTAQPVKYVGGGYYILSVENSPDAHIVSADNLGVDLARNNTITVRFMNHTPATRMRFRFTTDTDATWNDANSKSFDVVPNDNGPRQYTIDMSDVPGWKGRLKQLRLDLATGSPLTGTCRFDYIWVGRR